MLSSVFSSDVLFLSSYEMQNTGHFFKQSTLKILEFSRPEENWYRGSQFSSVLVGVVFVFSSIL